MASIGTTQIAPLTGTLPMELLPVAASQTLKVGDLVYLSSGQVTLCAASGSDITSSTGICGVMAQDSSSQAANTLVAVHPISVFDLLTLPTFGRAPTIADIMSGAVTTGFTIRNDGGVYKLNLSVTTNPVARIRNLEFTDGRDSTGRKFKATFAVGDRAICRLLAGAVQI